MAAKIGTLLGGWLGLFIGPYLWFALNPPPPMVCGNPLIPAIIFSLVLGGIFGAFLGMLIGALITIKTGF